MRALDGMRPVRAQVEWVIPVRFARVGPGSALPQTFRATLGLADGHTACLEVEVIDGVARCMALAIKGGNGRDGLRNGDFHVPVQRWLDYLSAQAAVLVAQTGKGDAVVLPAPDEPEDGRIHNGTPPLGTRRRSMDDELLQRASQAWLDGGVMGMMGTLGVSQPTAYRYLKLARTRGLLPQPSP